MKPVRVRSRHQEDVRLRAPGYGYASDVPNILLTNDDGIDAPGLLALRDALVALPGVTVEVIAPDSDRSATARSITLRRPITLSEVSFDDDTVGYATDGTPVDCVRFASLGLIDGFQADFVVAGVNHGSNLGDDVTYSGTVAAAWEGTLLGLPSIAVSQHLPGVESAKTRDRSHFAAAAEFVARMVFELKEFDLPSDTLLNVNFPDGQATGLEVTRLGKRDYDDRLELLDDASPRKRYLIYGDALFTHEPGTDLAAVAAGRVSVTPLRFGLADHSALESLRSHTFDIDTLVKSAWSGQSGDSTTGQHVVG